MVSALMVAVEAPERAGAGDAKPSRRAGSRLSRSRSDDSCEEEMESGMFDVEALSILVITEVIRSSTMTPFPPS